MPEKFLPPEGETGVGSCPCVISSKGDRPPFVSPRKGKNPLATPLRGGASVSAPASVGPGRCPLGTRTPLAPPKGMLSPGWLQRGVSKGATAPFEMRYIE